MVQATMAALFVLGTGRGDGSSLLSPTTGNSAAAQLAFSITSGWGMIIDLVIGVIVAPLGLWAFSRARSGRRHLWSLVIWLTIRVLSIAVVVASLVILIAATSVNIAAPWGSRMLAMNLHFFVGVLGTRVGLFQLPLWLFLIGLPIVFIERRRVAFSGASNFKQSRALAAAAHPLD
jgi:hypothetical protein